MSDSSLNDANAEALELQDWIDSLHDLLARTGPEHARKVLRVLQAHAAHAGVTMPFSANTPYINTIPAAEQPPYPGNREIERRIKSIIRWNAMAMVVRANREEAGIGGHISTYASAATLYEVGFNHFFRGRTDKHPGDIGLFSGPRLARHLCARVSGRTAFDRTNLKTSGTNCTTGGGPVLLSSSVADAGLLGIPHGLDGTGADHGHLSGALQPLSRRPRAQGARRPEGLGLPRRRRNRRAGNARRDHAGLAREARQSDLCHQLQPAAARRPRARQRQDHSGTGSDFPRRRLERDQGHLGQRLGSPARQGRRRVCW